MAYTKEEVIGFVKCNDVKFIRLVFCDLFGTQKNISIMPEELPRAFEEGISFCASAIRGFSKVTESDLFLVPDPTTLSILPWRPSRGRVIRLFCNIKTPEGLPYASDTRRVLQNVVGELTKARYESKIGSECEFYLFKTDEEGEPTLETHDDGTYLDVSPLDKGEDVRREICICLEQMGIIPETSHHEQGPGQNEIDFKYSNALVAADNILTFKTVVKAIARGNGLYATFMPKPLQDAGGSGLHMNLSLFSEGINLFNKKDDKTKEQVNSFIAGILEKIPEITCFLNPTINSYERFGAFEAPKYISWSRQNRSQLIRIPAATGDATRIELRSPDCSCNPYLAFALVIRAGMWGVENKLELPPANNTNLYTATKEELEGIKKLPQTLEEALENAKNSDFVKEVLGIEILTKYIMEKEEEILTFKNAIDKEAFYKHQYFKRI